MQRNRTHVAVLCLDVDEFKDINDAAGLATGDAVLRAMSSRIRSNASQRRLRRPALE
jgi:diguanylate cyclase (GGDEF)-like protein